MAQKLPLFIGGEFIASATKEWLPVTNPATQEVLSDVPFATPQEVDRAVASAKEAFLTWREVPTPERARLMLRYQDLLKKNQDDIARILSRETGKTFADAQGDVWRGIEVVEHACNVSSLMMGETVENVARAIDTYSYVQPLGVCVGITPFNFPAMIPLWMFPMAIACGNTFVLKPSEQDPMTPNRLVELFVEAGAPKGVLQLVHGGRQQVDALLTHPDVKAISFVGSVPVAQHVYRTGTQHLKRVQAMAGAKNHMVVMPDANKSQVISNLLGASCGAAGQRCMAISVAVFVGEAKQWIPDVQAAMANVTPGPWDAPGAAYGPQINPKAKERILGFIRKGKEEGATCLLDGSRLHGGGIPGWQLARTDAVHRCRAVDVDLQGGNLRPGAARDAGWRSRRGDPDDQCEPVRQRHVDLHRQRRRGTKVPARNRGRPGGHQRADSGAAAVLLVHRLETVVLR